jgi:DNA-binding transcriptional ArsR family regulator
MPKTSTATATLDIARATQAMKLLADPVRLGILHAIHESPDGRLNVGEICTAIDLTQPATSHHLSLMRVSGLLLATRSAKHVYYSICGETLAAAVAPILALTK